MTGERATQPLIALSNVWSSAKLFQWVSSSSSLSHLFSSGYVGDATTGTGVRGDIAALYQYHKK